MVSFNTSSNPLIVLFSSFPEFSQTCPVACSLSTTALRGPTKFFKDPMQTFARSLSLYKFKLIISLF